MSNGLSEQGFMMSLYVDQMLEHPCPQCVAISVLNELERAPDTTYGFTTDQICHIEAALCVLDDAADYGGVRKTLDDGTTFWLHKCGRPVVLTPFAAGRMKAMLERIAEGQRNKPPIVTEDLGMVDGP